VVAWHAGLWSCCNTFSGLYKLFMMHNSCKTKGQKNKRTARTKTGKC